VDPEPFLVILLLERRVILLTSIMPSREDLLRLL